MSLLRAELAKISSTRLWWGLLIGAALWTGLYAAVFAGTAGMQSGPGQPTNPPLGDPAMIRQIYTTSALIGPQVFALILGITGMTSEYRHQTITPTLLATPRRGRVVAAKMLAHAILGLAYGAVGLLTALVVGGLVISAREGDLALDTDGLWPAAAGSVLAVGLWTLIGVGLGTLIRNQVAAILVAVIFTFLVEQLLTFAATLSDVVADLAPFLPTNAASSLTSPPDVLVDYLPPVAGGLVLLGYAALFALLGVGLTTRRDVT